MKVAVVGGGPSGLVTAKTLLDFGHDVILLERDACIGGVWSRLRGYPLLRLLNTKHSFRFSTLCMPRNFDLFPTKDQVSHYLDMYVAQHNLAKIMRLGTSVNSMRPRSDGTTGWTLGMDAAVEEAFDHVVICTGPSSRPFIPQIKGKEAFEAGGGLYMHSSEVFDRSLLQNKRVIIVGYGQSAMEIANLAATSHAKQITVVARHITWKLPTSFLGLFPLDRLFANRFGETLLSVTPKSSWWKRTLRAVVLSLVELSARCEYKLGSNNLLPKSDLATAVQSSLSSDLHLFSGKISCEAKARFFNLIDQGIISVVRDDHLRELKADRSVETSNGARLLSADVAIMATGYQGGLPSFVTEHKSLNCDLYRGILPTNTSLNGLSFVGTQTQSSAMTLLIAELSALWIARHLEGRIYLPTMDEQKRERQTSSPFARTDALLSDLGAELGWYTRFFRQGLLCVADDLTVYEGVWDRVTEIRAAEIQTGKLILPSFAAATGPDEQRTNTPDERSDEKIETSVDEQPTMPGTLSMEMCSEEKVEEEELQTSNEAKEEEVRVREEIEETIGDDTIVLSPKNEAEGESECVKTGEEASLKGDILDDDRSMHAVKDSDDLEEKEDLDKDTDDQGNEKVEKVQGVMLDAFEDSVEIDEMQVEGEQGARDVEAISCSSKESMLGYDTNEDGDATALNMADFDNGATVAEDSEERRSVKALKKALSFLPRRRESESDASSSIESTRPPSVISLSKCRLVSNMATMPAPLPRKTGSESHHSTSNESQNRTNIPTPSSSKHARIQDPLGVRLMWKRHKPSEPSPSPSLHSPPPKAGSQIFQPIPSPSLSRSSFSSSTAPSLTSSSSSASSGGRSSSLRTPALLDRLDNCSTASEVVAAFHKQQQDRDQLEGESSVEYASQVGCPLVKPIPRRGALTTPPNLMKPPDFIRTTSDGLLEVVASD